MEKPHNTGNLLFIIFWWIVQHVNIRWAHKLLYWGLRDGSFPSGHCSDTRLGIDLWGHHFTTPIGLAAGVDKRGNTLDTLMQMGYSFGTFGPYTLEKEMPSQEKFFFKQDRAIVTQCNGYRNPGLEKMLPWFVKRRYLPHYIGMDIAIPAESEESNIKRGRHFSYLDEFILMSQRVAPYCDFVTLDFSHPNAELSVLIVDAATIVPIVTAVKETVKRAAPIHPPKIFIKIPLDLTTVEIPMVGQVILNSGADGVIVAGPLSFAKNSRLKLQGAKEHQLAGQVIGQPTHHAVTELIRQLYPLLKDRVPIIATGGVFNGKDAFDFISAGASMVALDESSLIFEGPGVLHKVDKELGEILHQRNFDSITKAIGLGAQVTPQQMPVMKQPQSATVTTPGAQATPNVPVTSQPISQTPVAQQQTPAEPSGQETDQGTPNTTL